MYCAVYFGRLGEFKDCCEAEFISRSVNFVQNTLLVSQEPLKHTNSKQQLFSAQFHMIIYTS